LRECGIPHLGRGKGPRLHELRHAFAIHTLARWYREGDDLSAKLPLLATYMGHQSLVGTQRYLRLTPEIFPDIRTRLEEFIGQAIPRRADP
jgi:integrase